MIKEIIATGVDANAAIESGALLLGLPREEVQFEIIDLPRKGGFLGLKKLPAKVRVWVELPDEKPARSEKPRRQEAPKKEQKAENKPAAPKAEQAAAKKAAPKKRAAKAKAAAAPAQEAAPQAALPEKPARKALPKKEPQQALPKKEEKQALPEKEKQHALPQKPEMQGTRFQVEADSLFLLGDNRNGSTDSRHSGVGSVHRDCLLVRAVAVIWPLDRLRLL